MASLDPLRHRLEALVQLVEYQITFVIYRELIGDNAKVSNTKESNSLGHLTPLWTAYLLLASFLLHFLFLCTHQVTTATMTAKTTTPPITAPITTHGGPSKMNYKMGKTCS